MLIWNQKWCYYWEEKFKQLKQQHLKATGEEMKLSASEITKLKKTTLPNTLTSTLSEINSDLFPNIFHLLMVLAVLPVTSCEVERSISSLGRLKISFRSSMGQERLTGLALMHIHKDLPVDIHEIVQQFSLHNPRKMKLANIFSD